MTEWTKWEGGENPVPGKLVNVRFIDGVEDLEEIESES